MSLDDHMASIASVEELDVVWAFTAFLLIVTTAIFWWNKRSGAEEKSGKPIIGNGTTDSFANGNGRTIDGSIETDIPPKLGEVSVSKILIHPIKSCKGLSVSESRFTPQGLEHDRKWCIIDAETHTIVTAREVAKMVLIEPRIEHDPSDPSGGRLVVKVPHTSEDKFFSVPLNPSLELLKKWSILNDCNLFKIVYMDGYICQPLSASDPTPTDVLSEYFGQRVCLMMKGPDPRECAPTKSFPDLKATAEFHDGYPILFASEESLQDVAKTIRLAATGENNPIGRIGGMDQARWKDTSVEIERFRPNILFEGAGYPWAEDMWRSIVISTQRDVDVAHAPAERTFNLVSKCTRCLLPNVDTKTGVRDAAVPYKVLMKFRAGKDPTRTNKPCFGCNGVPRGSGVVKVGDRVFVKEWAGAGGI